MTAAEKLALLKNAKRVGMLFSGGGARCVFQVGAVETLYELGIRPAVCLGVSIGAWNAAAIAVGNLQRLRYYWEFFCRMPALDLTNLFREHSPWIYARIHHRAYRRYVSNERVLDPRTLPLFVGVTRLGDRAPVVIDAKKVDDPFALFLASNYLPPFFTHPVVLEGQRYVDGGYTNNIPYEALFELGCDAVVLLGAKGESEGGLYRNPNDFDHVIPAPYRERVVVIRPRHRLPLGFVERRWQKLKPFTDVGRLRAREVLLGERHPETDVSAGGPALTVRASRLWRLVKTLTRGGPAPQPQPSDRS
ncbi:MAG TPA: patatin-like phospholipase family protein [Thermoanaerobaculia bacterium]|nr:patatin-like phospholipase family protein [Thermoanaerobaculia bacterium]